jgi:hypothetical protein
MQVQAEHLSPNAFRIHGGGLFAPVRIVVVTWLFTLLLIHVGYAEGPFEDIWESNFGLIDLTQDGTRIKGTYASFGGGVIDGTVADETFQFTWRDPVNGEGWGTFTLTPDRQRLEGVWGFALDRQPRGRWNASRLQQPKTLGTPSYWPLHQVPTSPNCSPYFLNSELAGFLSPPKPPL